MEEEEYEEVVEYYIEETVIEEGEPHEVITEITSTEFTGPQTTIYTVEHERPSVEHAAPPVRKKIIRTKVDPSKFLTPYLQHSNKMKDLFSENKYKEKFKKEKGKPYASTVDTPELRRIKKVQDQLSEVKYRMAGEVARTICHVDEKAKDIEHAKKVSQQVSKVLYKQNWEENKDKYLLPPDAPELVNAIKNTAMFSKKLYTEDWEGDKTLFYPYNDSPELRRVAQAQKALSDIVYKKGHDERKSKFTSLPDPPDVELAKKVTKQLSNVNYHEDYENKIKGKWSQTPCYDVAIAKMNSENISMRKYQEDFENMKDQIYFMQTETPEYEANKRLGDNVSKIKYRADYEKKKAIADYNVLPATENPLLKQLKAAGNILSDKLYKEAYERSKGTSINYCDTPKFQTDSVLKNFSDVKYKDAYQKNILGHYLGSYEDPHHTHCMKVEAMKSDKNYKADYEEEKTKCYFPQTITQEYEAIKKLDQCKDHTYKKHPDQIKFTQVTDSPVQKQAEINSKQLSDLKYKAKHESEKFKCSIPPDAPFFLQSRVNAYNISDNCYKYEWEKSKDKEFEIKVDAIPLLAAKAHNKIASDVEYKKVYEQSKGKMVGALSVHDDPKILHSMKVAKQQSDREYKLAYETSKTNYTAPLDMIPVVQAKKSQAIASNVDYKNIPHSYFYPPDSVNVELAKKAYTLQSDNEYKSDYNSDMKGCGWVPLGSLEVEKVKRASDILNEKKYRQHPDTIKFTQIEDEPVMVQAKINQAQRSDVLYKSKGEEVIHKYHLPPDVPQFIQAKVNAYNISDNYYKTGLEELKSRGYDLRSDAIPIRAAKAARQAISDVNYKKGYQLAKGKLIGFQSLQDDPKLVHYMKVAKIQSDREYKKDYEKTKTKYNTPLDMVNVAAAKKAQEIASNANYKNLLHHYTYLPDAMNLELTKNMMEIQSDNAYKQDYNSWFKGIGWSPLGSLDVEKAKKAGEALNEKKYRQHPDTIKFTSIPDSMPMVLAQHNTKQLSDVTYKQEGEKVKHKYTLDPDVPQFIQARVNAFNLSDANYKADWKKTIAKGYDLKPDAIPIIAAKASRNIASDYKYKESYEKEKGKQVGYRSLQDDPKLVHYMNVAKMQSDREYKKDYEITKTKYHTPLDMFSVTAAKKAQEAVTNTGYKQLIHNYTLLPDAVNLELSRNMMQIQSDNAYKADFNNWLRGVGWMPIQSLDVEKAKKATEILSEKKYRQHPDKLKYSITMDAMEQVLAKQNAKTMNKKLYTDKWNKEKTSIHVMPDTPEILQSRVNQITMSDKLYKAGWEEEKKKGYDMQPDAIPIKAAKASRDIASDYKYKLAYEKAKGKHIGFRSLEDDPKLVHFMQVAKMQSDREYKKDYEKAKTNFHTPVDMLSVVAAKKAQEVATNANYRNLIHTYNVLPDAMSLELAKNMMQIQSDNRYKAEYDESMKGVGWMPLGSLEAEKNKKAMEIVSEKKYRQHPDKLKYSVPMDSMNMVLAINNAKIMDEHQYKQAWEEDKKKVHITPDIPQIALAKANAFNLSDKMYRLSFEESRKKGYDLRADAIPIKAAKASRDIASDYKYKLGYEQDKGKLVGFRSLQDDPKLVHYMQVAKMQSDREYKKAYETSKMHYQTPSDALSIMAAKEAQDRVTNTNYKQLIHHYMLLPDAMSLELSRNMNRLQSDNEYKQDYNDWYKGIGWSPAGSLDVEKSKKATEIASDQKYRQHPSMFPFTKQNDAMDMVLAKQNAAIMNKHAYTQAWEKDKIQVHVMPDTPDILQAKQNRTNYSQKLYKLGWEEMIKKGYDLTPEAISVKAAKASRDIASDYKYKEGYRKQQGHHIGFRSLQDDPKMMWSMQVAKMQSEREYKKDFEKWKTKFNMPVDMLGFLLAKKCQELVSDIDYKHMLHRWTCLPDQNDVIQAKRVYELQSDNLYKSDLQWLKGLGWSPLGSLESEKNKKASEILSEKNYRQHPDTIKFTSIPDAMDIVLAKSNAKNRSDILYREAWDKDKTQVHIMPDTPEILLAKSNLINTSDKLYKLGYEELKKKGYDLPPDAIPLKAAKASREIASEYQYKTAYRKQLGHHIGARNIEDDPKMMWSMHVAKIQSDREYKKAFEKTKTHFSSPVDMLGIVLAKKCQELVSDIDYKHPLHRWTCLPDQNDVVQARKVYDLQSDNVYKSDLQWLRGIGWLPSGSLDDEKNKRACLILSDKKYRQHPDTIKFTSPPDSMPMVLAKHNSEIMNQRSYTSAWEKDKTSVHIMPDTPGILLAQQNSLNYSEKLYKLAMEEDKKKGYDLRADAIPIKSAKASRDIASDYKYKEGYRKQLGHHIGARNIEDDPKMMWSMHVAKIQSDREYKKAFEKTKTHFSSPVDMLGIVLAKKCQELVSDIDYKHPLHRWTCLPDQNDVVQARKVYDLQSDNVYKSDLQWLRGIGWLPSGSLDDEKNKRACLILSDKKYRQHPDTIKFTSPPDSMPMVLAKHNSEIMNQRSYTSAWEKDKTSVHIMPDTPGILLAQQNSLNYSEKLYKLAMEEDKKKGYDLRADAIPIKSAKASRDIASDYKYKEGYRKQLGHHIGARNIEDDPKMMWSMHVAKIQSDREYKKAFEKTKTHFSSPVDMLGIVLAKKCQELVSDIDYKHPLHRWTCLPDQNDVVQARKVYDLQSDNVYKSDLQWLRGIGWLPSGSLDDEKNKRACLILSDKKYRQHPDTIKFTSPPDSMPMVLAKHNSEIMNQRSYTSAWEKDKTNVHIMPDTPGILLAQQNSLNYSEKLYKLAMEEDKKKGYDLRADAIPIKSAKASRDIASDYKYKEGYRKQLGHHIGARNIEDDPKMMWSMHVAKIQSDREYKKAFEKTKTHFSSPVDMLGIVLAKKCQELVSDIDYKHPLHRWTCLPDQNDVIHAKKAYDLQSDIYYKSDLEWLRGTGWVPIGSLDVEKAKKAGEILSDKVYRQPPDTIKFTSVTDSLEMVLAKQNAETMNKRLYTEAWDKDKTQIHIMPDTPEITLAKQNMQNYSAKLYKHAMEESKKKGHDLRSDAIPIQAAKASREIASDYKYKEGYRKQLGHHIGARNIEDDPKMMWSMHVAKIQSDREYKKAFEKTKTHFSSPVDMLGIVLAKKCQELVSDIDYRHYLHQWTCLPDQNDVIHAKKAYDLQSDNYYKSDLEWLRGTGWVPIGSLDVEKAKKAGEILSDKVYRQPPDTIKFTSVTDSLEMVLAKQNAETMNKHLYTEAWNKDKTMVHVMPDTPEILLAKQNQINYSQKIYKLALEDSKKKGHDLRFDAIPIQAAKASREIASDYKYKEGYRKQLGHHIGARNIEDDPKMMWSMHVAKIQSDREYKKAFEKTKTHFSSPVDMLGIVLAKKCQELVSDIDYRHYLHQWICLPDQNDVIHAKKAYDLQSDAVYKSDLEWLRGTGWVPIGSVDIEKVKKAGEILSEKKYRQPVDQVKFTSVTDSLAMVLAKQNAEIMNKRLYTEAWDADKTSIHVMPDTPTLLLAKANAANVSHKLYTQAWDEAKMKGYDMRADAIPIRSAKASRDIASDYKYKETHEKQKGHYIGCRNAKEDPKLSWAAHVMQLQNDRLYRKAYHDSKARIHIPVDAMSVQAAKECQTLVSDVDYRQHLHEWTCLPDQNDVIHARKAYDLQSDNVYKSDLEWLRGIGWLTEGSVDVVKAKRAQELLNERLYRTRPEEMKFTSITDTPDVVQAKINALQISDHLYHEAWDRDKTQVSIPSDTPVMLQSKVNAQNVSNKLYQKAWEEAKAKSYDIRADAIPIKHAKASRDIASEYKYKETHEKQKGHYIGCRTAKEDPKLSWAARVMQLQNDRLYRKAYHDSKARIHIPVDAMSVQAAKECQTLVSDVDYRQHLHEWTCLPDQNDVIHARKAYDLQSDNVYKSDLEWLRGIGWLTEGSVDVVKAKRAQELLNERLYRTRPEEMKFTSITDTPDVVQAKINALQISDRLYHEAWDRDKTQVSIPSDTPVMLQSKVNAQNVSNKLYQKAWEEAKAKSYDIRADAIPIKHAKASRDIASEYKYKETHEKQKGHYIGCRTAKEDPKLSWAARVMQLQNDRLYRKAYHDSKARIHIPVDAMSVQAAKECQTLVSDVDYRQHLHEWTCLPDQNDVIHARKAYDLQSDNVYKSDLEWLRGIGWLTEGSVDVVKAKRAQELLNERLYRTRPEEMKFTSITDTPDVVQAKINALQISDRLYHEAWDRDKTQVSIPSDTPVMLQSKVNAQNVSNKLYQKAWEEAKAKSYDIRADAIPIKHAKASRDIASEYKYKETHEKQKGHYIGCRTAKEDPKLSWAARVMQLQNDRLYRKAYHDSKARIHIPVDAMSVQAAKECQTLVSDVDYRQHLHEWTCLPDQNDVIHARKAYDLQSDNVYKSDLEWLRGIGWLTEGSVDVVKAKRAQELLNERLYRTRPEEMKFTSITDTPDVVQAKINALQISDRLYHEAWDRDKTQVSIPSDTPVMLQSKVNAQNVSNKLYQKAWEEAKAKSYDIRADAIPIKHAKASRDIASEYKYKETHEKQKGHYIGCRTAKEDPKLSWAARVMQLQNDRLYRKAYHDSKARIHIPVDAMSVQAAKECQTLVSDVDYRQHLHEWTCLPDQNDVIHARKAYDLQSDNVYKSDLEWLRGIGWLTEGSVDVVKAKRAQELLNERLYRTRPEEMKFTSITDTPDVVQAKINALQISDRLYHEAWDRDKTQVSIPSDTPVMLQSKVNAQNVSNKLYQKAWEEAKAKSYDIRADAIPIKHAKASRDIASEYKYKETHEKQKGHYIGCRTAKEDPKLSWAARVMQLQNDRLYRKAYHDSKARIHIPVDAMSVQAAKECQTLVSDVDYRQHLHEWTCLPDQNDVIHARKVYDLQSDVVYKSDLEWLRGTGWLPNDSPDVKRVKHAQDLLSDNVYRTPIESLKFTSVVDSPDVIQAKVNAEQISIPKYKEAWEKDKTMIHIMADTPEINLAKTNALNYSQKLYKEAWDELKMSCDLRADAIPIKAAKASREIASDYKYKLDHEKQKGHYVGVPNAKADTRMRFALGIGKVQSELEYKKHFAKWKTQCHLPADMLSILSAKHGQSLVSDIDYRHYLHQWICLPDQNDVIQARKAYDLQSDAIYKSDLEWLRGIGWLPNDSVGINHVKYAGDLLNEKKYRTKAETLPFTPVADRVDYITAKNSGEILSDIKYHKAWNEVKSNYTLTDTPQMDMAREAARILNQNLYKESWEKEKATGYLLPPDTVQICHARRSNDVQSELKYKSDYVKQRGHYVGVPTMRDDPKLVWFEHAGEIQNDRLYKSDYHKTKSRIHIPADMMSVMAAKECQTLVSDIDYRQYLHEWTCHPDQNDCIQARKAYDLQSDNIYKSDLEWLRGCGWIPLDSVEHKKVKNAQELINKRAYTKEALDNFSNYTSVVDTPDIVLAKINSVNQSDLKYKETFNLEKGQYIGSDDTPALNHARDMSLLYSDKLYKNAWEISKPIGYTLDEKYIPLVGAKRANYINSELKYKEIYEKLKGHYLAGKDIGDFPSVIHSLAFQKIRSALAYRKNYEDTKANVHIPSDMMNHVLAKKCQYILSDLEYRTYFHQWNCSPEENDVIHARKAQEILSDVVYKDDLNWLKGLGCYVWDTPQILHAKKSYDLQSQIKYTAAGKENLQNFGVVTDTPLYVTAVQSRVNASDVRYKADYHKTKDKYTTVTETVDSERVQNLKHLFSNNLYKKAWDKVKATGYILPSDAVSLARAKELKHNASTVKYREEYDKFKALYTLPRGVEDDPNTARCLRVGKLNIDRLYKEVYEKNKAKIHIIPDMVDIISAKDAQKKVSEVDYRTHLHEWICLPDLQINAHVRKVTDQLSDVVYKDDLNWLKGIGCFVWDTPEILHAKHAYDLRSDIKYKSKAEKMKNDYTVVMDTPVYVQNVLSGMNLSEAIYRSEYMHNIKGKMIPTDKTVDLERASHAHKIQSENLYRWAGLNALPTGYRLPTETPSFQHAKHVQYLGSDLKYKEAYEHMKAKGYTLGPKDVGFENIKKVNQVINERLYRATYHKYKDKIHTTPDTPEIRQVRATQEAVSDLIYKSDFFKMQGHLISLPYTPQVLHCRYAGDITSDNKYKQDLKWLKGLGCFLYDTPDMVRARQLRKLWSNYIYTGDAKKMRDKYSVVLDTPEYRTVQELKTHLSELVYRAAGKKLKTKYTSILDTPDFLRAKQGQKIQSQYLYVELATKERPHHHAGGQTPAFTHAKHVKDMVSEKKYKIQYEKMKDKYTPVPDTPILIRAKRAYLNASDLRYKETFEHTKGKYHTVKDALDIVYHRKVTDDISSVKYKENYMSQLGIWRSIPDRPEHSHHRAVTDAVSDVKYKEDLSWLRGIGCYAWDTPDFALAEKNKVLYSGCKYKEIFEKTKSHFKYVADSPINRHFKHATQLMDEKLYKAAYEKLKDRYSVIVDDPRNLLAKWGTTLSSQKKYKSFAKMFLKQGCNEILRPDMLRALYNTYLWSQVEYKKEYEKKKDKYTTIVDTPEHLRITKVNKQISDIIYKLEYNKAKPKGYTTIHDTPMLLHVRKVKDRISDLKYKELYERNKSHCNVVADSVHIKTPRHAYKLNSNLDYKKKYEAAKAHWHWIADRPDFVQAAKSSLQQSDYEYKLDREFLKGCKLSVTDDKNTVLALNNAILASDVKYKEKHNKARGTYLIVPDTPQILLAKNVSSLVSENKYKEHSKKQLPHGSYTTLPETRDTAHVKEVTKNVSETNYKQKFVKEKGKSNYSVMLEPPEVKHAMEVAKKQSTVEYKKDAKSKLHYTPIADRPDIKKATQAAKLISNIEYKKRGEAGIGVTMLGRPDIELAKEVSKLTSQAEYLKRHMRGHGAASYDTPWMRTFKKANMLSSHVKYKENFSREKGKKPKYDLKEAKIYKTMKDAHNMASEVKYKADLKKLHKPVTDMSESLIMNHVLSTSQLASAYQYKKQYEKSKGHYHVVPDNLEQVHLREASELQSQVKYREKYEKEKGKPMLDFETPTYLTAKESQLMQSEKEYKKDFEESIKGRNLTGLEITPSLLHVKYATKIASEKEYRRDLEEGVKGKGLTALEETPDMLRAKNATQILNEKEYKKALELEIKGRGLTELALETPDFVRAKNATDIASQIKYKQLAEMEKANYTSVVDTPEIIHAQQVKNLSSQKKYKEDAERTMPYYVPVADTPEMQRVRENQKNFSTLQYQWDLQNSKGKVTVVEDTPEILRVKENQKNFSSILYKEDIGTGTTIEKTPEMQRVKRTQDAISSIKYKESIGRGTPIPDLPEVKRVKETQKHISSVLYKEDLGTGIPTPVTPEIERVKRNQEHISSVLYKEGLGTGTPTPVTPEMERVKRNQENISSVLYKEGLGIGTPVPVTPEMERVKRNQENFSSVLYKEDLGTGTPIPVTPEIERVKRNQENFSSVLYKEDLGTGTPIPVTPEIERVKRNQENFSSVLYKEDLGTGTPIPMTPEVERVKRNQEHISSVLYKESVGTGTPTPITPEMERVKRNQEICSSVLYKENIGKATPTPVTPEMERVKRNQEIISSVLYKENVGKVTPTPITPEMERVKRNQEIISSVLYKENLGRATPTPITPEMERVKRNQEHISSVVYKEGLGKATPTPITPEMERVKRNQEHISSVVYKEGLGKATPTPVTPEMERVKRNQEHISSVLYKEHLAKGTPTPITPEMERAKRNQENISSVLYSDSFRKQVQGKAAYVLDTPEMRRVRETQKHISTVKYHEDFEKSKGSFTPVVTDPITERVKKNMQDFSDISYRGIQRRVVEMERKRVDQDQENLTDLRVWRTNPGSVFDYDPAEDNIQSRSLHMISVQAQRRSREHSRSASALSLSGGDEKSEPSIGVDQHLSYYSSGGFFATTATVGYKHAKTIELPQQRSSSVATQQTTVSSVPSHPSTAGKTYRAMYDYMAADADEVSFKDGDTIVNVQAIDEGWMYGTVQRTGKTGMLPANYVEAV